MSYDADMVTRTLLTRPVPTDVPPTRIPRNAHRIVGEKHLLPSRMAVNLAFALDREPPNVLIIGLNSRGACVATASMDFRQWHFEYITLRKVA